MAKVKSATVRLVLKKSRANKNGEYPVYIVVCFGGRVEKSTGINCKPGNWDSRRECVKNCSNAPVLNKMLSEIKTNVSEGLKMPLISVEEVVYYSARHTLANSYLQTPGANIHSLASIMARSPAYIGTYLHQLRHDSEIADAMKDLPI